MEIKIDYDGKYPCLCSGRLKITIDGTVYMFPDYCLSSGGGCYRDDNWEFYTYDGPWSIEEWPKDFPDKYKEAVLKEVNNVIPWGCCGGCI